jgi:hypothetical protein
MNKINEILMNFNIGRLTAPIMIFFIVVETYGIDRIANERGLLSVDWFDFDYGKNVWCF